MYHLQHTCVLLDLQRIVCFSYSKPYSWYNNTDDSLDISFSGHVFSQVRARNHKTSLKQDSEASSDNSLFNIFAEVWIHSIFSLCNIYQVS